MHRTDSMIFVPHRGVRNALLVAVLLGGIAALWFWPVIWIPALVVMIAAGVFLASSALDREVRHETAMPPMPVRKEREARNRNRNRVGLRLIAIIGLAMLAVAIVVGGVLFDWPTVAVGMLAVLCLLLFFGLPVWVAAIQEEVQEEEDHLDGRSPPEP